MSRAYAGSGTTAGNRQGSSTYKAYGKNLEEKSAGGSNPSHCPESLFCSVDITANFYKAINVFFSHFPPREDSVPNALLPFTEIPFSLWPKVVQVYAHRDESLAGSYVPSYCESTK